MSETHELKTHNEMLLQRAMRGRLPITADIRFELIHFIKARTDGRSYDAALHHQKLCALLDRYGHRAKGPESERHVRIQDDEEGG